MFMNESAFAIHRGSVGSHGGVLSMTEPLPYVMGL